MGAGERAEPTCCGLTDCVFTDREFRQGKEEANQVFLGQALPSISNIILTNYLL